MELGEGFPGEAHTASHSRGTILYQSWCHFRGPPGHSDGTIAFSHLHQWFTGVHTIWCEVICWWLSALSESQLPSRCETAPARPIFIGKMGKTMANGIPSSEMYCHPCLQEAKTHRLQIPPTRTHTRGSGQWEIPRGHSTKQTKLDGTHK